eukprot:gene47512-64414_t
MSEERIQHQRSSHRVENMSEERIQNLHDRDAERRRFVPIPQEWDDANPCQYCHNVSLKSTTKKSRTRCCKQGLFLREESAFPKLNPLPEALKYLCIMRGEHFGKLSAKYNNILSIGSTGVENAKGGGFEQIVGDHALKMNGR